MTLTLPQAGNDPGRVARARVEPSTTGTAIAEFGRSMQSTFEAVDRFDLNGQLEQAQLDATRAMNDLRLEVEQIGDPKAAGDRWTVGAQEIRTQYLGQEGTDGALDPRLHDRFDRSLQRLENAHAYSLGQRLIRDRFAKREAGYIDYAFEATRQAATASEETRAELIQQGDERIDALVEGGVIDAAEAQRRKIGLRGDMDNARAIDLVNNDPAGFLEASEDPTNFPGLSGEQIEQRRAQAQNAIDAATARAETAAKAAERQAKIVVGNEIDDAIAVLKAGKPLTNPDFLRRDDVRGHEDYPELAAWVRLNAKMPDLAVKTPQDLRMMVREETARPAMSDHETQELKVLQGLYDDALAGWARDPIAFAREKQMMPGEIEAMPDPSETEAYTAALVRRSDFADWLNEEGYTDNALPLDKAELDALKRAADVENDPEDRLGLAVALTEATRGRGDALSDFIDDPVLGYAGGFVLGGGSSGTATEILKGQRLVELGNVRLPPAAERLEPTFDTLDQLFVDLPDGDRAEAQARQAADALYAARMRGSRDPGAGIDEDLYQQALHEVLGGTGRYGDSRAARGGVQELRDQPTAMPIGVRARDAEAALSNLGRKWAGAESGRGEVTEDAALLERQLKAISGGQLPELEGEAVTAADLDQFHLKAIGDDLYVFARDTQSGGVALFNEAGEPFTFSLRRLLKEVGE